MLTRLPLYKMKDFVKIFLFIKKLTNLDHFCGECSCVIPREIQKKYQILVRGMKQ
jgi:5,10-methylenetetrahydrofolate reductase